MVYTDANCLCQLRRNLRLLQFSKGKATTNSNLRVITLSGWMNNRTQGGRWPWRYPSSFLLTQCTAALLAASLVQPGLNQALPIHIPLGHKETGLAEVDICKN